MKTAPPYEYKTREAPLPLPLPLSLPGTSSHLSQHGNRIVRTAYAIDYKLRVVEQGKILSKRQVAKIHNLNESLVRRWTRDEVKLRELMTSDFRQTRAKGAGRKVRHKEMEEELHGWIQERKRLSINVTRKDIRRRARELCSDPHFGASSGWYTNFVARYRLVIDK